MVSLLRHGDLLAGGFLLTFASSLGQTWFIALSGPAVRGELGLGHGGFGALYSAATLASGLLLAWLGAAIDRVDLRRAAPVVAVGLAFGCFAMAAVDHPLALLPVFFVLRLCGQGLMSHLAMTMLARSFTVARGKALAIGGLGFPAAEALLPAVVVLALATLGWRQTWTVAGLVALVALPPLLGLLLRRAGGGTDMVAARASAPLPQGRAEILLTLRFALLLPAMLTTSFVVTAVFFHQGALATAKNWPAGWFAVCIPAYAAASVAATLLAGVLVDRWGARRLLPLFLLPLSAAMALLAAADAPLAGLVAMALAGLTAGASNTVVTAGLAEIYGLENLGTVRALGASAMIVASALSPVLVGVALDVRIAMEAVLLVCLGLGLGAGLLAARGVAASRPALPEGTDRG